MNQNTEKQKPLASFLRYAEAAALLRVAPTTLRRMVMEHRVPVHRPLGRGLVLFDAEELVQFVRASRVGPAGPGEAATTPIAASAR